MVANFQISLASRRWIVATLIGSVVLLMQCTGNCGELRSDSTIKHEHYDVVIAGGSTSAFAAAIAAAKSGAKTALLEPTDWVGGQLTSSGVPAVDEAWHKISEKETGKLLLSVSEWAR